MKKKICIIIILVVLCIMIFTLTGCGNNKSADNQPNNVNTYSTNVINEESTKNDTKNNVLLGKWSGKDSINRDSTWEFQNDKVIFSQYYDYVEKTFYWEGNYSIVDDNTVIIKVEGWDYEKTFNYEIKDDKYLTLINTTEEQPNVGFPDFKNLEKIEK